MEKPKIFISHITEEKDLAKILKEEIEKAFLGLPEIFVSSDGESISVGTKWLDEIDQALKEAQIILLLCSKGSVTRPWINFEAGAGWVKGIPIIPVCHTNIRPIELPIPINMLQGIEATSKQGLEKVFQMVGKFLGASFTPNVDYDRIIDEIKVFEKEYGVVEVVKQSVKAMIKIEPQLEQILIPTPQATRITGYMSELTVDKLRPHFDILKSMGMSDYNTGGNKMTFAAKGGGNELELTFEMTPLYYTIAEKVMK